MFIYGALVENKDDEARADIDALLAGTTPPSEERALKERQAALDAFAHMGEVAGADR